MANGSSYFNSTNEAVGFDFVGVHVIFVDIFSPPKFNVEVSVYVRLSLVVCYVWKRAHGKR